MSGMHLNNDVMNYLEISQDPYINQILKEQIREQLSADTKHYKKQENRPTSTKQNIIKRINMKNMKDDRIAEVNEDDQNYEDDDNKFKRERHYEVYEPPRFKLIGYTNQTRRKPLFTMTDLYLCSNPKINNLLKKCYYTSIYRQKMSSNESSLQYNNSEEIQKIMENLDVKDEDDFNYQQNKEIDEQQLEKVVVDLGDQKKNYFMHIKGEPKVNPNKFLQPPKNNPLTHPDFLSTLWASVNRLSQQYNYKQDKYQYSQQTKDPKSILRNRCISSIKQYDVDNKEKEKPRMVMEQNHVNFENQQNQNISDHILQYFCNFNADIVHQKYHLPLNELNRIQFHLNNPNFFLPKLHTVLGLAYDSKGVDHKNYEANNISLTRSNHPQKSIVSGSRGTGNKKHFRIKHSLFQGHFEGGGEGSVPIEDGHQSIQKRIEHQIKNIYKEPLHHSQVAIQFDLISFTLNENNFHNYHRYSFPFDTYLQVPIQVRPFNYKPRRIKPKDLILNSEMMSSHNKFCKKQHLSLSQGNFILVEYIEQTPLIMSNTGMCERLFVQVNYQQMLQKISKDIFENTDLEALEKIRDKIQPQKPLTSFEKKTQLWRKNIKDNFGENGKLLLWDPNDPGKLIGKPEGLGVTIMESNLATVPVVKKNNNPRDFILIREGKNWYLRKINNLYVTGQIEPNRKIFNPDSRDFNAFKSSYEKAFMRREIIHQGFVTFDKIKSIFDEETQNSLKKALKSIHAVSYDSKKYAINDESNRGDFEMTPEEFCLYERMQKSICEIRNFGIYRLKNNEKIKNVMKQFNKRNLHSLQKFTIAKLIRQRFQLTSWNLTQSFWKFKQKTSKIEISGFADPTNGRGGYSYINKPQKERTCREDMEEREEKQKVSGTSSDLRKLKADQTKEILINRGYAEENLNNKGRWDLVRIVEKEEGTEYERKEKQTKSKKIQNEKKEISRKFNSMLSYLKDEEGNRPFKYNFSRTRALAQYMQIERHNWEKIRDRIQHFQTNNASELGDQDQFGDSN